MEHHGSLSCSDEDKYLSTCQLLCDIGYEVIGANISTCTSFGKWNRLIGSCQSNWLMQVITMQQ